MVLSLKFSVKYRVPPKVIYEALTDPKEIIKYTQSAVKFEKQIGSEFSLYNGYISGINEELVENEKIVQKWKMGNWKDYADLTIVIKEKAGNECQINFSFKNIPEKDADNNYIETKQLEIGYQTQICQKLSDWLGYPLNKDSESDEDN